MSIFIKVKRQNNRASDSYYQTFEFTGRPQVSVLIALHALNMKPELIDVDGNIASRISYESSCVQKRCGACAMLVNGVPSLACEVFLADVVDEDQTIIVEPLSKFPVVRDLVVDRDSIYKNLRNMKMWVEGEAKRFDDLESNNLQYKAASCLKCGLCLEVCDNYKADEEFVSAPALAAGYKLLEQNANSEHRAQIAKVYYEKFFKGCNESYDCQKVCPAEIPMEQIFAKVTHSLGLISKNK